ncbi:MAG: condensation domain-containing protein, partial [Acidobacteriota bacterium]|nr:condensation domain-containing protein [Acidobacteriota bacterium]
NGLGYGLLRDYGAASVRRELARQPVAQILFNHLGQMDTGAEEAGAGGDDLPFGLSGEGVGPSAGADALRTHLLDVETMVQDGRLEISLGYSRNRHKATTMEALADAFVESLERLAEHCQSPEAGAWTPSDFPLARIDQETLDSLATEVPELQDLYPLSPLQQGMLFETIFEPEAGVYVGQMTTPIDTVLDQDAFEKAWRRLVERQEIFRTSFRWEGLDRPLQLVQRSAELPIEYRDWSRFSPEDLQRQLTRYLEQGRSKGFELETAPLSSVLLAQVAEESYLLVWSFHQILLDGWSLPLVFEEFQRLYGAACQGTTLELPQTPPFRNYIEWLDRQGLEVAEVWWKEWLAGFDEPTPVIFDRPETDRPRRYAERVHALPKSADRKIQSFARQHKLTVNTLVQASWALLLARYANVDDVVFGVTVSGRPPELDRVEEIVGLFINTLPTRVRIPRPEAEGSAVLDWLEAQQARQLELRQYEHTPLAEVQKWSDVAAGDGLFDTFMVFQNYPLDDANEAQKAGGAQAASADQAGEGAGGEVPENVAANPLASSDTATEERSNFALTLVAYPDPSLAMDLEYNAERHDVATIERMLRHLETLLTGMVANPQLPVAQLPLLSASERQQLEQEWGRGERVPWPAP